jgi:carbon starvation protein CstA
VITTLDTAVRLNRYLIEELWQELFGRFDVFAARAKNAMARAVQARGAAEGETAGASGIPARVELPEDAAAKAVPTSGLFRTFLRLLTFYWVNSGIAVGLMLWLSFSAGILQLWKVFGTANQLLAAFVLSLGTIWLLRNGRKVWYVVAPAVFMLSTTLASLVLLLIRYMPRTGADGAAAGNPTLFVSDLVLLVLTLYLVIMGARELLRLVHRAPVAS